MIQGLRVRIPVLNTTKTIFQRLKRLRINEKERPALAHLKNVVKQ